MVQTIHRQCLSPQKPQFFLYLNAQPTLYKALLPVPAGSERIKRFHVIKRFLSLFNSG